MNVFENLFICANEHQEKVGIGAFGSFVVDYTKYLTWMPLLAPSMNSFVVVVVKHVLEMKEDHILMHLKGS